MPGPMTSARLEPANERAGTRTAVPGLDRRNLDDPALPGRVAGLMDDEIDRRPDLVGDRPVREIDVAHEGEHHKSTHSVGS